jgi:predicted chitinase
VQICARPTGWRARRTHLHRALCLCRRAQGRCGDCRAGPLIALEYFRQGNVNAAVHRGDFAKARRITNGGSIGLVNVATIRNRLLGSMRTLEKLNGVAAK